MGWLFGGRTPIAVLMRWLGWLTLAPAVFFAAIGWGDGNLWRLGIQGVVLGLGAGAGVDLLTRPAA